MLDDFDRFKQSSDLSAGSFVAVVRIIVALLRRPRWLLTGFAILVLIGAITDLRDGWLIPIALVLLAAAFLIFRYVD